MSSKSLLRSTITLAAVLAVFGLTVGAYAAGDANKPAVHAKGPGSRPEMRMQAQERMQNTIEKLGLSEQQQTEFKAIMQKQAEQVKAIREDSSLTQEQKQEKMIALRPAAEEQINKILTPEQQKKYAELRQNQGQNMRQRISEGAFEKLGLTDDQKAKVKAIRDKQRQDAQAIQADTSIPADQKAAKLKQVRQTGMDEINKVLTPEQQAKFKEMQGQMPNRGGERGPAHRFGGNAAKPADSNK